MTFRFPLLIFADGTWYQGISIKRLRAIHGSLGIPLGKVMISLSPEAEQWVRREVDKVYYGRTGGFSIFFEHLVRSYFNGNNGHKKASGNGKPVKK